jgi:hypothetical protein
MARKSRPHDEELPFVALMDTMTNVVGVLIIVLVLIGLGLARSVKKVLSDLPMVDAAEHEKLKEEMQQFKDLQDPAEIQEKIAKLQAELQKIMEALKALDAQQQKNPVVLVDIEKLKKQLEAAQKERNDRKTAVDGLLAEIDKLKIKLDTTPPYVPPADIGVNLPNTKPMPDKAEIHRFLISENRIMHLANTDFRKNIEQELRRGRKDYTVKQDVVKDPTGKPVMKKEANGQTMVQKKTVFDSAKMTAFFNAANVGNRDTKVEVVQQPNSPNVQMRIVPKPGGGETIEQIKSATSQFRSVFNALKSDKKSVIWFHVCRDSIPAYLAIRDMVDAVGVPVGWDLVDRPVYSENFSQDFMVEFTPPPAPPVDPNKPPPINIAAPKSAVD